MAIQNFIPELWSANLLEAFDKEFVFAGLVNRDYQGEITQYGDTVKITTPGDITVGAYAGTVSYQTPISTQQSLLIDQDYYWAFELDDVDQAQASVNIMQAYMRKAGVGMANSVDLNIAALYASTGLADTAITLSSGDMYDTLVAAGQKLDEANVPSSGRWCVMSPAGYAKLLKTTEFVGASNLGDAVVQSGMVGEAAGFRIYKSNNLTLATTRKYMYGTNDAITYASQLVMQEVHRRDTSFKDGVRGRFVYGRKVVQPSALGVISATE